ncbi:hypothetical protein K461DRAFT_281879 [Myriangium duriaei CBS 260.36]|uniref:Uncharacterized protein n=1 Tax=Myriangium duriaei CBS 260.36 TaxID=1168546 RepID=A0A9P4MDS8_9PEZI|nr:hypothetical protein K461DRAFT_281879 [Myriangium duriaei CBS 260.36]
MSKRSSTEEYLQKYRDRKPDFVKLWDQHLEENPQNCKPTFTTNMPVLPQEEETHGNITDQVAKGSDESTASSHPIHQDKATVQDHHANPGPVIAENLGEPASKEELKKRSDELNKK